MQILRIGASGGVACWILVDLGLVGEAGLEPTTPGLEVLSRPYPAFTLDSHDVLMPSVY
jgi:hypothetical protein